MGFKDAVEEMRRNGVSLEDIKRFDLRVVHFLGLRSRYFECEVELPDGEILRLDWSEYFSLFNEP